MVLFYVHSFTLFCLWPSLPLIICGARREESYWCYSNMSPQGLECRSLWTLAEWMNEWILKYRPICCRSHHDDEWRFEQENIWMFSTTYSQALKQMVRETRDPANSSWKPVASFPGINTLNQMFLDYLAYCLLFRKERITECLTGNLPSSSI